MQKIITYNFSEDFISNFADYLVTNFIRKNSDLSRVSIIFGGKRPSLFLKRELAKRNKRSFFPPQFFSIDQFVNYIVSKNGHFHIPHDLESYYIIYNVAKKISPELLLKHAGFSDFLPTAQEIAGFIDELDIENISAENLKPVETLSEIGYEIPPNINKLLTGIIKLRNSYHNELRNRNFISRGLMYMDAAKIIRETKFPEFDKILFCNFYYLHNTEKEIIKYLINENKASAFFQKDSNTWPVFDELSKLFNHRIEPPVTHYLSPKISIYKGFDSQSQAGLAREILKREIIEKDGSLEKTVIILPDPDNLVPLLSEISTVVEIFNVSMGYPLKRSTLYNLIKTIVNAQLTKKGDTYYTRDYIRVILNPLIKNLKISSDPAITRILVHKTEEVLLGMKETPLSGSLFLELDDIENSNELFEFCSKMAPGTGAHEFKNILKEIHRLSFRLWENITDFSRLSASLEKFNDYLLSKSFIHSHPINTKILDRIYGIIDELKAAEFKNQPFDKEDIFRIFDKKIHSEAVSFSGSPLKGLQILGLFESRSLNFENVIIMDVNESIIPGTRDGESIIPWQVMENLGLQKLKQEEEIQRYHFMRLVSGAKKAYLIYDGSPEKEKSRFLEEIIWQKQKEQKTLNVFSETCVKYNPANASAAIKTKKKNEKIIKYFKEDFIYSPSSVDTYLNCPVKFYYQYVLRLREKEDLLDEVEARDIGTFIHELLDYSFRGFLNKKPVIDNNYEKGFFDLFSRRFSERLEKRLGPEAFLVREVMEYRLKKFLENERSRDVKKVLSLEEKLSGKI
ncbi:MAG: PD-(D/E)XK nuclease family protein, partial [bacterium]